jgi:hypothetical protein
MAVESLVRKKYFLTSEQSECNGDVIFKRFRFKLRPATLRIIIGASSPSLGVVLDPPLLNYRRQQGPLWGSYNAPGIFRLLY